MEYLPEFAKGQEITDKIAYLNKEGRKSIAIIKFSSVTEVDIDLVKQYIYEALFIDEQAAKAKG